MAHLERPRPRQLPRQAPREPLSDRVQIGASTCGRPIEGYRFEPPGYARARPPALLFGAIHGDEPLGVYCLQKLIVELLERPPGRTSWIVPCLNIDGVFAGTKNNASDVDLNRNFAAANWSAEHKPGYFPGASPESEPETQALARLIEEQRIERIVALHSPFRVVNWDGRGQALAEAMAALNGYGASSDIGYPTPGSLGSKYGVDRELEVVTLEIPMIAEEDAWRENRAALRFTLDLPA